MAKTEKYLPLKWVERFSVQFEEIFGKEISPDEVRVLCEEKYSATDRAKLKIKHPRIVDVEKAVSRRKDIEKEYQRDINGMSLVTQWARNKQVYALDEDFTNELLNTKTIALSKDAWDYLPYNLFYVDLSANRQICEKIIGEGVFIKVEKFERNSWVRKLFAEKSESYYAVHLCKVVDNLFFTDIMYFPNTDFEHPVGSAFDTKEVDIIEQDENGKEIKRGKEVFDGEMYSTLIPQILSYMASVEPDMQENENTKRTYRKPAPNTVPKNKFSEVQQWDVGVRFGNSFRRWKKQQYEKNESNKSMGIKQRPHARRAHWSHYWYGHGDDKVRRPKWIAAYFVNIKEGIEQPATIHKVNKDGEV